jgi:putative membrane protein
MVSKKHFLSVADKQQIASAIAEIETRTQGELVAVIASASADYRAWALVLASGTAFLAAALVLLFTSSLAGTTLLLLESIVFVLGVLVLDLSPSLLMRCIPGQLKRQAAQRCAREQFIAQRVNQTKQGSGVLLFVSVAERYVEILADHGINAHVSPHLWDGMINDFVVSIRSGRIVDGFLDTIRRCGALLQTHYPAQAKNINELPNRLIEL